MGEPARQPFLPVEFRDVALTRGGRRLIDGLSFRLEPGCRTVVMGPNGAGKSLTLRLLQGLIAPSAGEIVWARTDPKVPVYRRSSIVFQRPVLLRRSVAANLRHALSVYDVPAEQQAARVAALLALGELTALADSPARVLSGGEQQRLALVRALAAEPELLLLDEPTASLDPRSTELIERIVLDAHDRGTSIALITHDPGQARRISTEVLFLHEGRAEEQTPAAEFFTAPGSAAARAYLEGRLLV